MPCPDGLDPGFGLEEKFHAAICQIRSRFEPEPGGLDHFEWGTGLLFRNRNTSSYILTAAHVIFSPRLRRYCARAELFFPIPGEDRRAVRVAQNRWVPEAFENSTLADPRWDFGVFRTKEVSGPNVSPVPLFRNTAPRTAPMLLTGYPNEGACSGSGRVFHGVSDTQAVGDGNFDYAALQTYAGMSGGPLLHELDDRLACWGVHIRGEDPEEPRRAVRLNDRNIRIIANWLGEEP